MYVRRRKDIIGNDFESYIANIHKHFSENLGSIFKTSYDFQNFVRFSTQFCHVIMKSFFFLHIAFNLNYASENTWAIKFYTFDFFNKL